MFIPFICAIIYSWYRTRINNPLHSQDFHNTISGSEIDEDNKSILWTKKQINPLLKVCIIKWWQYSNILISDNFKGYPPILISFHLFLILILFYLNLSFSRTYDEFKFIRIIYLYFFKLISRLVIVIHYKIMLEL